MPTTLLFLRIAQAQNSSQVKIGDPLRMGRGWLLDPSSRVLECDSIRCQQYTFAESHYLHAQGVLYMHMHGMRAGFILYSGITGQHSRFGRVGYVEAMLSSSRVGLPIRSFGPVRRSDLQPCSLATSERQARSISDTSECSIWDRKDISCSASRPLLCSCVGSERLQIHYVVPLPLFVNNSQMSVRRCAG